VNSKIKIYKTSARELSLQDCKALPFLKIDTGWDSSPLPWSFEVCLVQDIKNLWLLGKTKFSAGKMPDSPPNSYIEGLANFDVIEFFFAGKDARYSEYHVAPLGRWWMQTFTTPRQKDPEMHIANVIVESDSATSNGWATSLKIPINTWMKNLGSEPISGNITATFRSQSTPLASLIKLPGEKPNFHQPTHFTPLEFIKLD
jgi:hypothetical protein